jgi:hypothetical protein
MILYGELTKLEALDDGSIRVHGIASTGARDSAGEIVLPEAVRDALPAYMAFGAIREMHQPRAAGAALSAEVDDDGATRLCAHVIDPVAVQKVKAGVYKGLSIGGKVLSRDPVDPSVITSIRLDEISLVDRPCNPEAVIDLWKAQGLAPKAAPTNAPTNAQVLAEAEAMARAAGKPRRRSDYVAAAREKLLKADAGQPHEHAPVAVQAPAVVHDVQTALSEPAAPPLAEARPRFEDSSLAKLLVLESDLHLARTELDGLAKGFADERAVLHKRLAEQAAEIERLSRLPRPPRTAGSAFAKAVAKEEDGQGIEGPTHQAASGALGELPSAERAHVLMKAALARPMPLRRP